MKSDNSLYWDYRIALANHEPSDEKPPEKTKVKITRPQRKALKEYNSALAQEDRYLGSVFVTPHGQEKIEAKTKVKYDACKALGMTHEHGL
jgi:hypothetical protein